MEFDPKVELASDDDDDLETQARKGQMKEHDIRLYLIRRTIMQMLRDRGYLIGDMEIAMSREDFWEMFGNDIKRSSLDIVRVELADPTKQIFVFFPDEVKVGVTVIKRYAELMKDRNVKLAILVVQRKLTLYGKQSVNELSGKYRIEVFQEAELLVNVKESVMVPEHHIVTSEEKNVILERYSVKLAQLPRLLVDDPVARYYGLRKGQMVKIVRPDQAVGDASVSYRLLV